MSDELRAVAERLRPRLDAFVIGSRDASGEPDTAEWPVTVKLHTAGGASVVATLDLLRLAKAYLAEHPADDGEPADADWLEKRGFDWSACGTAMRRMCGPIEVCVTGDVATLEKDTHLSLHWSYPGPPKVTQYYGLDDNPTRATVRRLCAALGEPLTEPPAK